MHTGSIRYFERMFSKIVKELRISECEAFSAVNKSSGLGFKSTVLRTIKGWVINKAVMKQVAEGLEKSKRFELPADTTTDFLKCAVPECFYIDDIEEIYYGHYDGIFFKVFVSEDKYTFCKDDYDPKYIYFDFSVKGNKYNHIISHIKELGEALSEYSEAVTYTESNYTTIKEVPVYKGNLDTNYSFTRDEIKSCDDWIKKHEKKYHKKDKSAEPCAGMASKYKYEFSPTNLGIFKSVCCEACRNKGVKDNSFCCNIDEL